MMMNFQIRMVLHRFVTHYNEFRSFIHYCNLNHNANRLSTSVFEVQSRIPETNQLTLSDIGDEILQDEQRIGRGRKKVDEVIEYLDSKPSLSGLKDVIPASYFLKNRIKAKSRMFLIDRDIACNILKILWPHIETCNGHVMEINAGTGVLTEELLKVGVRNLRIYEPDALLCNHLLELIKHYKSDARLFRANMFALGSLMKRDYEDCGNRIETVFDGLPHLSWDNEPVVKVIGALRNDQFIAHIMFSIALQNGLCDYGRPELFLILPQELYEKLKSSPAEEKTYRSSSVLFQVFFDHEVLMRVPEKVFIPWSIALKTKKGKNQCKEVDDLYLLKITPKRDLLQTIPPDLLKPFWVFVKLFIRKKSSLLIDRMEKWIPGSGVRLIAKGYSIFTDCGSLTPDEYVKIYLEFSSWPEFHSCSYLPFVQDLMGKILKYTLEEQDVSDKTFNRILSKESNVSDNDINIFSDNENLEHEDKDVNIQGSGR